MNTRKLLLLFVAVSSLSCTSFPAWREQVLRDMAERRGHGQIPTEGGSSTAFRTVELYGADGRHLGYGVMGPGNSIDVYRPDGSRLGYGRGGR